MTTRLTRLALPVVGAVLLCIAPPSALAQSQIIEGSTPQSEIAEGSSWKEKLQLEQNRVVEEQGERHEPGSSGAFLKMFEGLGYCLALFLVGVHLYTRFHRRAGRVEARALRVIETLNLPSKVQVHLVEANGHQLLVSSGSQPVSICRLEPGSRIPFDAIERDVLEALASHESPRERVC